MNRVMVVTGVSGVGKDFLLGMARERLTDDSVYFDDFGEIMFQFCKNDVPIKSKDMLRQLRQDEITPYIMKSIEHIKSKEPAVITSHSIVSQQGCYTVNYRAERMLHPKTYVFVTAPPETILEHRISDESRERELIDLPEIKFHNDLVKSVTSAYAEWFGSKFIMLENKQGNAERNVEIMYREILNI